MSKQARRVGSSILDRLMDTRPDQDRDRPRTASETMADLRASIHRDVEALLNTRRPWCSVGAAWPALRTSPASYGMSDFTAGALNDESEREALRMEIESAICRFEPRLASVHVELTTPDAPLSATLTLRIDAMLLVEPQPEPVSFDTVVEVTTADVTVRSLQDV